MSIESICCLLYLCTYYSCTQHNVDWPEGLWTGILYFFAVGLRQAVLDPKFDEEHDARISFGNRPWNRPLPACARAGQSRKIGPFPPPARQSGNPHACTCMHKNRLNVSDLSSDHACRILAGWLAGWLAGSGKPGSNGLEMVRI